MGNKIYQQSRPSMKVKDVTVIEMPNVAHMLVLGDDENTHKVPLDEFTLPAEQVTEIGDAVQTCIDNAELSTNSQLSASQSAAEALAYRNSSASIVSGGPRGVYATSAALIAANPDHQFTYVVTADGHWYYWNGSTFADGGEYQKALANYIQLPENKFPNQSLNPYPFVNGNPVDYAFTENNELWVKMVGVANVYLMPFYAVSVSGKFKKAYASLKVRMENDLEIYNFSSLAYFMLWGIVFYEDGTNESFCQSQLRNFWDDGATILSGDYTFKDKNVSEIHYRIVFNHLQNITTGLGMYLSEPTLIFTDNESEFNLFKASELTYIGSERPDGSMYSDKSNTALNSDRLRDSYPYYSGKKACFLGDSITVQNEWQPLLADLTGITYDYNEIYPGVNGHLPSALGGATVRPIFWADGVIDSNVTGGKYGGSLHYRADSIQYYNPDVIFVYGGTNDMDMLDAIGLETDVPYLGDEVDTRTTPLGSQPTFYASYKGLLQKLTSQNKNAKIICLTPMYHWHYDPGQGQIIDIQKSIIRDAIIYCAKLYSCEVVDFFTASSVNNYNASIYYKADNTDEQFQAGAQRVHPNSLGGVKMASLISTYLK